MNSKQPELQTNFLAEGNDEHLSRPELKSIIRCGVPWPYLLTYHNIYFVLEFAV